MRLDSSCSSSNTSSSFDKVLSRLEKTIDRVQCKTRGVDYHTNDHEGRDAPSESRDDSNESRDDLNQRLDQVDYRVRLQELANKVKVKRPLAQEASGRNTKTCLSKQVKRNHQSKNGRSSHAISTEHEETKLAATKRTTADPNNIIWRAYGKTHSFSAIVCGVVAMQALVRRYLTMKRTQNMKRNADLKEAVAKTMKAAMNKFHHDPLYSVAISGKICLHIGQLLGLFSH
jgi:hypothetical protein